MRRIDVNKTIGQWRIVQVYVNAERADRGKQTNRNQQQSKQSKHQAKQRSAIGEEERRKENKETRLVQDGQIAFLFCVLRIRNNHCRAGASAGVHGKKNHLPLAHIVA